MPSPVTATPPASPAEVAAHFALKLAIETDCADVHDALARGTADFVLLEARGPAAYARGHVPGALNLPHREITAEHLAARAADLVQQEVAVIVASGYAAVRAAQDATHTIPVVMLLGGDPIGSGLIPSLTRPGGNLTGLAALSSKFSAKRLALLKAMVPTASRVAVLFNPDDVSKGLDWTQTLVAARALGLRLQPQAVRDPHTLGQAFAAMRQASADALITFGDVFTLQHRRRIATLATQHQLPAIYELKAFVEAGGLMAYGPRPEEMFRRVAGYVDKILKGAKPGDLPIEQPTTFELVINLRTAQALGLPMAPTLLSQANEVIR